MNNIKIHIKKYISKKIILLHIVFFTLYIFYSSKKNCYNFELTAGKTFITNKTSIWQFVKNIKYNNDLITDIFDLKYTHITNTTNNGYLIFKGYIGLYDKDKKEKIGLFKEFLYPEYKDNFIYNFKNNIEMNNETYYINLENNILKILYLNNCTNNTCLYEKNNICYFKDNIYNDITVFLTTYFEDKINANIIQPIYFLLKFIFLIILLNIFILLFYFIIKYRIYKKVILDGYIPLN